MRRTRRGESTSWPEGTSASSSASVMNSMRKASPTKIETMPRINIRPPRWSALADLTRRSTNRETTNPHTNTTTAPKSRTENSEARNFAASESMKVRAATTSDRECQDRGHGTLGGRTRLTGRPATPWRSGPCPRWYEREQQDDPNTLGGEREEEFVGRRRIDQHCDDRAEHDESESEPQELAHPLV